MSARNGDKARFGKQRKRKMAHRARTRDLREGLPQPVPVTSENSKLAAPKAQAGAEASQDQYPGGSTNTPASSPVPQPSTATPNVSAQAIPSEGAGAEAAHGEHHGVLDSAAGAIGSVLGTLASKVKAVLPAESTATE